MNIRPHDFFPPVKLASWLVLALVAILGNGLGYAQVMDATAPAVLPEPYAELGQGYPFIRHIERPDAVQLSPEDLRAMCQEIMDEILAYEHDSYFPGNEAQVWFLSGQAADSSTVQLVQWLFPLGSIYREWYGQGSLTGRDIASRYYLPSNQLGTGLATMEQRELFRRQGMQVVMRIDPQFRAEAVQRETQRNLQLHDAEFLAAGTTVENATATEIGAAVVRQMQYTIAAIERRRQCEQQALP